MPRDPRVLPDNFETVSEAKRRRARCIGVLKNGDKRARVAARTMGDCAVRSGTHACWRQIAHRDQNVGSINWQGT